MIEIFRDKPESEQGGLKRGPKPKSVKEKLAQNKESLSSPGEGSSSEV